MVSEAVFISLICFAFTNAQLDPLVKVPVPYTITQTDYLKAHFLQPGYVNGARDCGGPGRTLQWTHSNCLSALPAVTCLAEIEKFGVGQMYFVAGEDANDVIIRATIITSDAKTKSVEFPVPGMHLRAGHSYVMPATGHPDSELMGKLFTGRVEILKGNDKTVQACSEIDFIGYKP